MSDADAESYRREGAETERRKMGDMMIDYATISYAEGNVGRRILNYLYIITHPRTAFLMCYMGVKATAYLGINKKVVMSHAKSKMEEKKKVAPINKLRRQIQRAERKASMYEERAKEMAIELKGIENGVEGRL